MTMKVVVIGGTGLIGSRLVAKLRMLLPGHGAVLSSTHFEDWITQSVPR